MNVLIVAPRSPWPPYTGDRVRATMWIEALRDVANVVVVTPGATSREALDMSAGAPPTAHRPPPTVIAVVRSSASFVAGVGCTLTRRTPVHTLLAAPWNWRAALREANERHGTFDVAIVLLTRTDPYVFRHLPANRRILDAIDSAARGMNERAVAASSAIARAFWRSEARRALSLEQSAITRYDDVVTVAPAESAAIGPRVITIPMGVDVAPLEDVPRRYDFGFFGRFPYFANEEAVRVLVEVIWPEIRRRRSASTLFIGGAEAPRWLREKSGRDGIDVVSPVDDRRAALRNMRVALIPILRGTGQSLKTLEAAEAGCAIVGTAMAFRGIDELASAAVVEDDLARFAERAVALIESGPSASGANLRTLVLAHHDRARSIEAMRALVLR